MNEEKYINERIKLYADGGQPFAADAFLLAAYLGRGKRAAELGCGSGICSMLAADRAKFAHIDAYEIQEPLVAAAAKNVELNSLAEKITVHRADIRELRGERFDAVFANPPYLICDGKQSPDEVKNAARRELSGGIDDFCAATSRLLASGGGFCCVYRPDRLTALFSALRDNRLEPKRITFVHHRAAADASMILVSATKDGSQSLCVTRPLILFGDDGKPTCDSDKIYESCGFEEFFGTRK